MKIAICYDRVNKFGGAERVLQALHELWPEAPIFTLTYNRRGAFWAKGWDIRSSFLQKIPILGKKHELFPLLAPIAWEQFNFNEFDVVISVTSSEAKAIVTSSHTKHICYCLTPTRYLWSGFFDYLCASGFGRLHFLVKRIFLMLSSSLRVVDYYNAQRPDVMVGISDEVCARIKKHYGRDSLKVYPPVEVFSVSTSTNTNNSDPYFLVVSRLVPYKRIDIVVEVFNLLGWPIKIVGTGSEYKLLKQRAKSNIEFLGFCPDEQIVQLYENCVAVVFPSFEDFGIVPVEAQAYGKPVIAFRGGGALETVIENKTGLFFDEQTVDSLFALFEKCSKDGENSSSMVNMVKYLSRFSSDDCKRNAAKFSKKRFQDEIRRIVESCFIN